MIYVDHSILVQYLRSVRFIKNVNSGLGNKKMLKNYRKYLMKHDKVIKQRNNLFILKNIFHILASTLKIWSLTENSYGQFVLVFRLLISVWFLNESLTNFQATGSRESSRPWPRSFGNKISLKGGNRFSSSVPVQSNQ